jgi:phosphoserine phosphatase RsbU/P
MIALQPGNILAAFSDGVAEPENACVEFGEHHDRIASRHRHKPLAASGQMIIDSVADWIGDTKQPDDMTVVLARAR